MFRYSKVPSHGYDIGIIHFSQTVSYSHLLVPVLGSRKHNDSSGSVSDEETGVSPRGILFDSLFHIRRKDSVSYLKYA